MTTRGINVELRAGNTNRQIRTINNNMRGLGRTSDNTRKSFFSLGKVFVAVTSALATNKVIQYSDAWTKVNNQIAQATDTANQALGVQERLFQIAKEGRSDLEGTAVAYQRISASVKGLGFSSNDTLDVVDGLTKAFKANGATAQEVSSIIVQLGQGLGAGALQGDELKSILEASIPVANAIAKEFGVARGELKKLGADGVLTSERVFNALQNALPEFNAAFQKSKAQISDGFTVINNSTTRLVGEFDKATGASSLLADGLIDISDGLDGISDSITSGQAGKIAEVFKMQFQEIGQDVDFVTSAILKVWDSFGSEIINDTNNITKDAGFSFLSIVPDAAMALKKVGVEFGALLLKTKAWGVATKETIQSALNPFGGKSLGNIRAELNDRFKQIEAVKGFTLSAIDQEATASKALYDQKFKEGEDLLVSFKEQQAQRKLLLSNDGGSVDPEAPEAAIAENPELERIRQNTEALIRFNEFKAQLSAEELTREQMSSELSLFNLTEGFAVRREAVLNDITTTDQAKSELIQALFDQEAAATEAHQASLTDIVESAANDRSKAESAALNTQLSSLQNYTNSAFVVANAFGNKSEKQRKKFGKAQIIINTGIGITRAFADLGWPAGIPAAAMAAATGAAQLSAIGSAGGNQTPSSSGDFSSQPTAPTQNNSIQGRQTVYNIDVPDDAVLTGAYVKSIFKEIAQGDDDVIIAITESQNELTRLGRI